MDASKVIENVSHGAQIDIPKSERETRPLTRLDPEDQPAAWQRVLPGAYLAYPHWAKCPPTNLFLFLKIGQWLGVDQAGAGVAGIMPGII